VKEFVKRRHSRHIRQREKMTLSKKSFRTSDIPDISGIGLDAMTGRTGVAYIDSLEGISHFREKNLSGSSKGIIRHIRHNKE